MLRRDSLARMTPKKRYQRGSVTVSGGKVHGEFRKEPDANGKREHVHIVLGEASRNKTKAYWRDLLKEKIDAYYAGLNAPAIAPGMTVREFVETVFWPAKEPTWAYNTRSALKSSLKLHILKPMGDVPMKAVVKATIVERLNEMRAAGYSKRSIRIVKWLLHSIFEEALDNDLIEKTPVRKVSLRGIPNAEETRPLTEDEVRRIYGSSDTKRRLIWRLMIGCGLRPGELCALRRNDVAANALRIDESAGRGPVKDTKTSTVRFQPIPKSLRAELDAWLKDLPGGAKAFLFTRDGHTPMSTAWMRDHVELPAREATGIQDLTLRMARATFGTLVTADISDVQDLMGHADPQMTLKHYRKGISERQIAAVEDLDARLTKPALRIVKTANK